MECSVCYPGFAVDMSKHYPGSVNDFNIFCERIESHRSLLLKKDSEILLDDNGEGCQTFKDYWAVLVDKGYQGANNIIRAIQPKKNLRSMI